ncbi:radical SAM protein [Candidatus Roizmanbacteria bacterium]|nr:radical SAM protein [Candidatus Roizmanbacteria bacterium]
MVTPEALKQFTEEEYSEFRSSLRSRETPLYQYDISSRKHSMVMLDIGRNWSPDQAQLMRPNAIDSLYHHVNSHSKKFYCDRGFLPDDDLLNKMANYGVEMQSQGVQEIQGKNIKSFDVIGISVTNPLQFAEMMGAIKTSGIEPLGMHRGNTDPLVILGGEGMVNPLPFAPFGDVIVVGDGEEVLLQVSDAWSRTTGLDRNTRLNFIKNLDIPGVFVSVFLPVEPIPAAKLKYNNQRYIPGSSIIRDGNASLVINKGCQHGSECRFCQYGHTHSFQQRRFSDLVEHMRLFKEHGATQISIISAAASGYFYKEARTKYSVGNIIDEALSLDLQPILSADRPEDIFRILEHETPDKVLLAPEASPQLRESVLKKTIKEEVLLNAIHAALDKGVPTISLYGIVGIPGETEDDLKYFSDLAQDTLTYAKSKNIPNPKVNLHFMPLLASPHTPLETVQMIPWQTFDEKLETIRNIIPEELRSSINIVQGISELAYLMEILFKRGFQDAGLATFEYYQALQHNPNTDKIALLLERMTKYNINFDVLFASKEKRELPNAVTFSNHQNIAIIG